MSFLVPLVIQNLTSFVIPTPYGSISFGIVDAFTILGVIGAIIYSVRSYNSQQTERKFQKLIEVYKMINNFEQREARKNIYKAYDIYYHKKDLNGKRIVYESQNINKGTKYNDVFRDPEVLREMGIIQDKMIQDVERVRATLDHIGALYENNLVPKKGLLDSMWGTVRVCWICLEHNIMIERDKRQTEYYMDHFKHLFEEIEKFIDEKRLPHIKPYGEFEKQPRQVTSN